MPGKIAHNPAAGKGTGAYVKGNARREALLEGAETLLHNYPLDELSLKDIAEHVGIPVGSAYHFFSNAVDVYTALAQRFGLELQSALAAPYTKRQSHSWQTLFDTITDRAAKLYSDNSAYRQLIIGPKAPPEIKLADRDNDERVGALIIEIFSRHFVLPVMKRPKDVFFHTTEIVDLLFTLSNIRHGKITPAMLAEAKKAGKAYLGLYLPAQLPANPTSAN